MTLRSRKWLLSLALAGMLMPGCESRGPQVGNDSGLDGASMTADATHCENETTFFIDCDKDGYAASTIGYKTACTEPDVALTGCLAGGGWTKVRPENPAKDCNDANADVHPGQTAFFKDPIPGNTNPNTDFDYNCDLSEEGELVRAAYCFQSGIDGCGIGYQNPSATCSTATCEGWDIASPPYVAVCGATVNVVLKDATHGGCVRAGNDCNKTLVPRTQKCR